MTKKMGGTARRAMSTVALVVALAVIGYGSAFACTSVPVGALASSDGSVMTSQTADGGPEDIRVSIVPAADHKPGEMRKVYFNSTLRAPQDAAFEPLVVKGEIPQVAHTYRYINAIYGMQNEHQLSIGETTIWNGERDGLQDPEGMFNIVELSHVALERCTTAREAVKLMGELVDKYGYCDYGECLTVADTREVWQFEVYGATPTAKSGVWAAERIPDDQVGVSANRARIDTIDLSKPDYFMASANVQTVAIANGWYDPKSGKAFSFCDAYCPDSGNYYSSRREWRVLSLLAPSLKLDPSARKYPFSVKPDKKVSVSDITAIYRDHYEGTPFDLTKGLAAGPFGSPDRYATQYDVPGSWERAISIYRCCYSYVTQSRASLPDPVGGVVWFAWDVAQTSCYMPLYGANTALPAGFDIGWVGQFDRKSAFWAFNFASNWVDLRYDTMIKDVKARYGTIEAAEFAKQASVEKAAADLYAKSPKKAIDYLTKYSVANGNDIVNGWWTFGESLIGKYHDGYDNSPKAAKTIGYPKAWLEAVGYGPIAK
jgi:dipeptidase